MIRFLLLVLIKGELFSMIISHIYYNLKTDNAIFYKMINF